jgi:hypothetical protein
MGRSFYPKLEETRRNLRQTADLTDYLPRTREFSELFTKTPEKSEKLTKNSGITGFFTLKLWNMQTINPKLRTKLRRGGQTATASCLQPEIWASRVFLSLSMRRFRGLMLRHEQKKESLVGGAQKPLEFPRVGALFGSIFQKSPWNSRLAGRRNSLTQNYRIAGFWRFIRRISSFGLVVASFGLPDFWPEWYILV